MCFLNHFLDFSVINYECVCKCLRVPISISFRLPLNPQLKTYTKMRRKSNCIQTTVINSNSLNSSNIDENEMKRKSWDQECHASLCLRTSLVKNYKCWNETQVSARKVNSWATKYFNRAFYEIARCCNTISFEYLDFLFILVFGPDIPIVDHFF